MTYDGPNVLAAIQTWWEGTPSLQALTSDGNLWYLQAPESIPNLPYATYFLVSDPIETWTTGYAQKRAEIQVNLHASTAATAKALQDSFRALVGKPALQVPLTISGSPVMHSLPSGNSIELGEGLGPNGQDCWVAIQTIDIPYTE